MATNIKSANFFIALLSPTTNYVLFMKFLLIHFTLLSFPQPERRWCRIAARNDSERSNFLSCKCPVTECGCERFSELRAAKEWKNNGKRKKGVHAEIDFKQPFYFLGFFLLQTASYFFRFALRKECIIKQIFASTSLPLNEIPRVSFAPQNVFK